MRVLSRLVESSQDKRWILLAVLGSLLLLGTGAGRCPAAEDGGGGLDRLDLNNQERGNNPVSFESLYCTRRFTHGTNMVTVRNSNPFAIAVGLRSNGRGKDFTIPAHGFGRVYVPDGEYEVYVQLFDQLPVVRQRWAVAGRAAAVRTTIYYPPPKIYKKAENVTLRNQGIRLQFDYSLEGNHRLAKVK